jgi:hypothetical protein
MQYDNESTATMTFLTYVRVLAQNPEPIANLTLHHITRTFRTHLTNNVHNIHANTNNVHNIQANTRDCNAEQSCVLSEPEIITAITITYISPAIRLKTDSVTKNKTVTQKNPVSRANASEFLAFPNNVNSDRHS